MNKHLWVERTKPANPSKLGVFLVCRLRYVFETELLATKKIGDHPSALLGTAVHDTVEVLRRAPPVQVSASVAVLEQCIGRLVTRAFPSRRLIAWVLDRYGHNALLPRAQFVAQAGFAWALAQRMPRRLNKEAAGPRYKIGRMPVGVERRLASEALDIVGRADEIFWQANKHVRIVDFKTGAIRDSEGKPMRKYVMQLAAYGLVVRELDQSVDITLELVGKGDQWTGPLDEASAHDVTLLLRDLRAALPRGKAISIAGLACVGEHCGNCAYRPSCPGYRVTLEQENVIDHGVSGFDICGINMGIKEENGFCSMRLSLRQDVVARISNIPAILLPGEHSVVSKQTAAFGIRSLEPTPCGSPPQNFTVVDLQRPRNSAFQCYFEMD